MCHSRANASSSMRAPAASWRSKTIVRSRAATSSCREARCSGVGSTMCGVYTL
jgi:hypothetical protein